MVQEEQLDAVTDDDLRVYVVWTPVLQEDDRHAAAKTIEGLSDKRLTHFWDLGFQLGKTVTLPRGRELAWDVYFVLDSQAEWSDAPAARVLQGLLRLTSKYRSHQIEAACDIAHANQCYRLQSVRKLIQHTESKQQQFEFLEEHPLIRNLSEYGSVVCVDLQKEAWKP